MIPCPHCEQAISPDSSSCLDCGVLLRAEATDDAIHPVDAAGLQATHRPKLRRQAEVDHALRSEAADFSSALVALGAWEQHLARGELLERLRHEGAHALDTTPQELTPQLISQYYTIKRGGFL